MNLESTELKFLSRLSMLFTFSTKLVLFCPLPYISTNDKMVKFYLFILYIYLSFQFQYSCSVQLWRGKTAIEPTVVGNPVCLQPKFGGPCRARVPRYFYNIESKACELFHYGGCTGNENNFETMEDCTGTCVATNQQLQQPLTESASICSGPPEQGPSCEGMIPRWTYNTSTNQCTQIIYGGCGATRNNFVKSIDCQLQCGDKSSCSLPKEPGLCFGLQKYWWYNSVTEECLEFDYGGCGGNSNRFYSRSQCEQVCLPPQPEPKLQARSNFIGSDCEGVRCPGGISHYEELNCKPIYDDGACCPTRFECPERVVSKNSSQCVYKNKLFNIGDYVRIADSEAGCRAACTCTKSGISCAHIECADVFGYYPKEECRIGLYKPGSCCAYDYACGNETHLCEFEGHAYIENERIYPKEAPCLRCYCKPGFNGTLSMEFCEKIDCGIQIWYSQELERGCTPVYFQNRDSQIGCCPIAWKCPDDYYANKIDAVATTEQTPQVATNNTVLHQPAVQNATEASILLQNSNENATVTTNQIFEPVVSNESNNLTIVPRLAGNNANSTWTAAAVQVLEDACSQPLLTGECKASRLRYFYNSSSNECQPFYYSGCKGNQNNFVGLTECKRSCVKREEDLLGRFGTVSITIVVRQTEEKEQSDPCTLPVSPGRCRAFFPRYFFSVEQNQCLFFIFGGCHRNGNNFFSKESCEATCMKTYPNVCEQKPLDLYKNCGRGVNATKFYFDSDVGYCQRFISTGCTGDNVFNRLSECDSVCAGGKAGIPRNRNSGPTTPDPKSNVNSSADPNNVCYLPKKVGTCNGHIPSYYYDVEKKSCMSFVFGGCFGNLNRFPSMDACQSTCEPEKKTIQGGQDGSFVSFDEHDRPQVEDPNVIRRLGPGSVDSSQASTAPSVENHKQKIPMAGSTTTEGPILNESSSIHENKPPEESDFIFARIGRAPSTNVRILTKLSNSSEELGKQTLQLDEPSSKQIDPPKSAEVQESSPIFDGDTDSLNQPQVEDPSLLEGSQEGGSNFSRPQTEDPSLVEEIDEEDTYQKLETENITELVDDLSNAASTNSSKSLPLLVRSAGEIKTQDLNVATQERQNNTAFTQNNTTSGILIAKGNSSNSTTPFKIWRKRDGLQNQSKDICKEVLDVGSCNQTILRFYWDGQECRPFNFTGCSGNRNRFRTEYDCRQVCDDSYQDVTGTLYCIFGSHVIPFGNNLHDEESCAVEFCTCSVPPSLTCTVTSCDRG